MIRDMMVFRFHNTRPHLLLAAMAFFALSACAAEPNRTDTNLSPGVSLLIHFNAPPTDPADPALLESLANSMTDSKLSLSYVRRLAVGAYLYRVTGLTSQASREAFLQALQGHVAITHAEYNRRVRHQ